MKEMKYQQISKAIRAQISEGFWKPGARIYSERQLSELHNVSRLTVKRALSELVSEGLLEYREGRQGTFVTEDQHLPREIHSRNDMQYIGVAIDNQTPAYATHALQGIHDLLWDKGFHTIYCNTYANDMVFDRIQSLLDSSIAGLIYSPVLGRNYVDLNRKIMKAIDDRGIPLVLIDRYIPERADNHVVNNNRESFRLLVRYLIEEGHKEILYIHGFDATSSVERRMGFYDAFEQTGTDRAGAKEIQLDELDVLNSRGIPDSLVKEVASLGDFTAIVGLNQLLLDVGKIIAGKLGKNVVTATATAGKEEKTCDVAVVQPIYEVGREAAELIVRMIGNSSMPVTRLMLKAEIQDNRKVY